MFYVIQGVIIVTCIKPEEGPLMYLCVKGVIEVPVSSQMKGRTCSCVLRLLLMCVYQARRRTVMYLCVKSFIKVPVSSQKKDRSYICVLRVLLKCLYQAR